MEVILLCRHNGSVIGNNYITQISTINVNYNGNCFSTEIMTELHFNINHDVIMKITLYQKSQWKTFYNVNHEIDHRINLIRNYIITQIIMV